MKNVLKILFLLLLIVLSLCWLSCSEDNDDDSSASPDADDLPAIASAEVGDNDDDDNDDDDTSTDYSAYVDPFWGTAGDHGQLHPAATLPFGMVKLGPDTLWIGHSGYNYQSPHVLGFSHTRIGGVGCSGAGGNLRFAPSTTSDSFLATPMDKTSETATPGFYGVTLQDGTPIQVELTTTQHVGLHRYTFDQSLATGYLRITADFPFSNDTGHLITVNGSTIEGWVSATTVCNYGQYKFFFSITFDQPFQVLKADGASRLVLAFDLQNIKSVMGKVALSTVSEEDAALTASDEVPGWDFEKVKSDAKADWNTLLGKIEVSGEPELLQQFYTYLYRSMMVPVSISGTSGQYRGTDAQVHIVNGDSRYHCWSLWDTYRTKYSLLSLITGDRYRDIMRSLAELFIQGKEPWANATEPFPTVRTEHGVALLLDALQKDVDDFGMEDAYDAIIAEAQSFSPGTPDTVLETAYDYWAVAKIADALGETTDAQNYLTLSQDYQDVWIDNFLTMGADADVVHARGLYEGTLWQYRWAVIHDLYTIMELMGGREEFLAQLSQFFDEQLYNHGNEPDIHAPFLFNYVGAPFQAQEIVRDILLQPMNQWYGTHKKWPIPYYGRIYRPEPKGFFPEMDDDVGTMSAWFVMASLGLYQVTVGQPVYALTSPIFTEATIHNDGSDFTIRASGLSDSNIYIQEAYLNDMPLSKAWITHEDIANGGVLELIMGPNPSSWGTAIADAPPDAMDM